MGGHKRRNRDKGRLVAGAGAWNELLIGGIGQVYILGALLGESKPQVRDFLLQVHPQLLRMLHEYCIYFVCRLKINHETKYFMCIFLALLAQQ